MGFNFSAFASGAVSAAGKSLEEQHKATKDSIDKNIKFAYESGLPYTRQRKERIRSMTKLDTELGHLGLSKPQIDVVMGGTDASIADFIKSSKAEVARTGGKFEPASQVVVDPSGASSPWQGVQFGTVDQSALTKPDVPGSSSLLSKWTGTEGSTKGYDDLTRKSAAELERTTGVSYQDVQAASQGAYTYGDAALGTITMANTSQAVALEGSQLQLAEQQALSSSRVEATLRSYKQAKLRGEWEVEDRAVKELQNELAIQVGEYRLETGIDIKEIDAKLESIVYNTRRMAYGDNPSQGLYIANLALMEETAKGDEADITKLATIKSSISSMNLLIGEQLARTKNASQSVSWNQWDNVYEDEMDKALAKLLPDVKKPMWIYDRQGNRAFDFSLKGGKAAHEQAAKNANVAFALKARNMVKNGMAPSAYLEGYMSLRGSDPRVLTLPGAPSDDEDINPTNDYVVIGTSVNGNPYFKVRSGRAILKTNEQNDIAAEKDQAMKGRVAPNQSLSALAEQYRNSYEANQEPPAPPAPVSLWRQGMEWGEEWWEEGRNTKEQNKEFQILARDRRKNVSASDKNDINTLYRNLLKGDHRDKPVAELKDLYINLLNTGYTSIQLIFARDQLAALEE